MDQQTLTAVLTIITFLLGIIMAGIWRWVDGLQDTMRAQQREIADLTVKMAGNYMPRDELSKELKSIFDKLDEIQRYMRRGVQQ